MRNIQTERHKHGPALTNPPRLAAYDPLVIYGGAAFAARSPVSGKFRIMVERAVAEEFVSYIRAYVEARDFSDPSALAARLAENVTLHTPRFWRPITDRNWLIGILNMVPQAIDGFTYHRSWIDGSEAIMEFKGEVNGLGLQGIDIFTLNDEGKVESLTVFVRPPNALAALGEIEDVMLKKLFGVATQKEFSAKS